MCVNILCNSMCVKVYHSIVTDETPCCYKNARLQVPVPVAVSAGLSVLYMATITLTITLSIFPPDH